MKLAQPWTENIPHDIFILMHDQKPRLHKNDSLRLGVSISIILLIYIGIPLCILMNLIPWNMKFVALVTGAMFMYLISRLLGHTNSDLGFTFKRSKDSLLAVTPLTLILLVASILFLVTGGARFQPTEDLRFFIFYVFISCPAQELLFRGVLSNILSAFRMKACIEVAIASLLFGFVHIIYRDALTVVAMIIVGFFWYRAYKRAPSLVGVTVSHVILGVLTIAVGLVD